MTKFGHFIGFLKFLIGKIKFLTVFMWFHMMISVSTWFLDAMYAKYVLIYMFFSMFVIFFYCFIVYPIKRAYSEYNKVIDKL